MVQWSGPLEGGRCSPSTTQALVGRGSPIGCYRNHCGMGVATILSSRVEVTLATVLPMRVASKLVPQAGLVGSRKR